MWSFGTNLNNAAAARRAAVMRLLKCFVTKLPRLLGLCAVFALLLHAQPSQLQIQAIAPPAPVPGAAYIGTAGGQAIYYWVVARYPAGAVQSAVVLALGTVGIANL